MAAAEGVLTPFARFSDAPNFIAAQVDATVMEAWRYEGVGIHRYVCLARRAADS